MNGITSQPIRITDHLYQLGAPSFPAYLSLGDEAMLIEGGTGPTAGLIIRQLALLGIDPLRIRQMILTHSHPDHIGAIPRLRPLWPHVEIVASATAARFLRKESLLRDFLPTDRTIGKILKQAGTVEELPPELDHYCFEADRIVEQGERICLGKEITWHVFPTPGHSPCHTSFYEEKEGVLVLGDMAGYYVPSRDLFWPNYFSSLEEYCASITRVMDLPARFGLLAHNGVIRGKVEKFLAKALSAAERYHVELLERVSKEDPDSLCKEKADWVWSLGPLASYKAILFLCSLLLTRSIKEKEKVRFSRSIAAAA